MTPADVAQHPSVTAVRDDNFDFSLPAEFSATCAVCGRIGTARSGERAVSPCDHPDACAFLLVAPTEVPARAAERHGVRLRGAFEQIPDMRRIPRVRLPAPPPPRGGDEWQARYAAVRERVPELAPALTGLPIGWSGLVEMAAHALDARSLGRAFRHRQSKEKFGTARIYVGPARDMDDPSFIAASGIVNWAEAMTAYTCARDGTPDGRLGRLGAGWWITLGERAWAVEARQRELCTGWKTVMLELYPEWARPNPSGDG